MFLPTCGARALTSAALLKPKAKQQPPHHLRHKEAYSGYVMRPYHPRILLSHPPFYYVNHPVTVYFDTNECF